MSKRGEKENAYVTFSGNITHKASDTLRIFSKDFSKIIHVNLDGSFNDSLKVESGFFDMLHGNEYASLFLKNGYEINLTLDAENFDKSLVFSGKGAENNTFLLEKAMMESKLFGLNVTTLKKEDIDAKVDSVKNELNLFLASYKNIDSLVIDDAKKEDKTLLQIVKGTLNNKVAIRDYLSEGTPSPVFTNYRNYNGGSSDLSDYKGKYVYIDVWATWCGPCIGEIPSLKKMETMYHDKNIWFC